MINGRMSFKKQIARKFPDMTPIPLTSVITGQVIKKVLSIMRTFRT